MLEELKPDAAATLAERCVRCTVQFVVGRRAPSRKAYPGGESYRALDELGFVLRTLCEARAFRDLEEKELVGELPELLAYVGSRYAKTDAAPSELALALIVDHPTNTPKLVIRGEVWECCAPREEHPMGGVRRVEGWWQRGKKDTVYDLMSPLAG